MLLAVFAVLSSKRTKSDPILHFRTVFRPWKMTRSRKQPVFDTKRKIYLKARFKYILPFFCPPNPLHLLESGRSCGPCSKALLSDAFFHANSVHTKMPQGTQPWGKVAHVFMRKRTISYWETVLSAIRRVRRSRRRFYLKLLRRRPHWLHSVLSAAKKFAAVFWPFVIVNTHFWW